MGDTLWASHTSAWMLAAIPTHILMKPRSRWKTDKTRTAIVTAHMVGWLAVNGPSSPRVCHRDSPRPLSALFLLRYSPCLRYHIWSPFVDSRRVDFTMLRKCSNIYTTYFTCTQFAYKSTPLLAGCAKKSARLNKPRMQSRHVLVGAGSRASRGWHLRRSLLSASSEVTAASIVYTAAVVRGHVSSQRTVESAQLTEIYDD